ncbi:MAG: hypothetical protein IT236_14240 [Bacteroidia bacterium]|nr:hypothetical protein [Bacteroidia bacterium]
MNSNFNNKGIKKPNIFDILIYSLILGWVLYYRYQVLMAFSFVYTDSDQNIMWEGLRNYSRGEFHEPRFYGQAYNTFLEALLAVPLYWKGMAPYVALPFVTMLLTLVPFIVISFFTFLKRSVFFGCVILSLPLLLPPEYAFITSMPRGFVTGIFFAGLGCIGTFYPDKKWSFFYSALMAMLAYTVNSNAVLLSLPCLFYLFLMNLKKPWFYALSGAGILLGGIVHFALNYFYTSHPFYNLHGITLEYSFGAVANSLKDFPAFFGTNTPLLWKSGYALLISFLVIGLYFLIKKEYRKALPVLIMPLVIVLTLGVNKVHDGTDSVFFHLSRMYLSLPLVFAFSLSLFSPDFEPKIYYLWLLVPRSYYHSQLGQLETSVQKNVEHTGREIVLVSKIEPILMDCERLASVCKIHKVDLFVVANHFYFDAYAHGCTSCMEEFPKTLNPRYERRTWRLLEDENKVYKTVMFIDMDNHIGDGQTIIKKIPETVDLYLVENNRLKTMELLDSLHVSYRVFRDGRD